MIPIRTKLGRYEIRSQLGAGGMGVPQALFDLAPLRARADLDGGGFDVTAGGQRFIFISRGPGTSNSQYTVVINWMAEAKK